MRFIATAFQLLALATAVPSPAPIAAPAAVAIAAPVAAPAADAGLLDVLVGPLDIDILGLIEIRVDLYVNLLVFIGVELGDIRTAANNCQACRFVTTQNICIALELCPGTIPDYSKGN